MYRLVKFGVCDVLIRPYTTRDELELLEFLTFTDYENDDMYEHAVDEFINRFVKKDFVLNTKIEKIIMLLSIRNITLGDEFNIEVTCPYCNRKHKMKITLSDIVSNASEYNDCVKHKFVCSSNLDDTISMPEDDDMDMNEYEYITSHITDYMTIFNDTIPVTCSCGKHSTASISSYRLILSLMSDDSFNTLTNWIHALVCDGKHTRSDVLDMTPVQRMMERKYFEDAQKTQKEINIG